MRRRLPVYRLLLVLALLLGAGGIALHVVTFDRDHAVAHVATIAAFAAMAALSAVELLGLLSFVPGMRNALRALLAGEFDSRVKVRGVGGLAELCDLMNRALVQLKEYDELRALRTGYANRAMYLLLGRLTTPAIIFDLPRGTGRANPACHRAFDLAGGPISIEFLRRHDTNVEFNLVFAEAFEQVKRERNTACMLRLSPSVPAREVDATFVPIKGDSDDVELGLVLLTLRAQTPGPRKVKQDA